MTKVYFLRHGKVHNPENIFYGRLPHFKLAKEGRDQIKESANYFNDISIDTIYSSNLSRAKQSAEILSKQLNCNKVSRSNLITEVKTFVEGKPFEFVKSIDYDYYFSPLKSEEDESMTEIRDRMIEFVKLIEQEHPDKNVIAVSHGDPLMILKAHLSGLPMKLPSIRPGGDKFITYGEIYCVSIGDDEIKIVST